MNKIETLLKEREEYLTNLIAEKEHNLHGAPDGTLRINCRGDKTFYYHRKTPSDRSGTYLSGEESDKIQLLAQKEYDKKIVRAAEQELSAIKKYRTRFPAVRAEQIYEKLHKERQKLIIPVRTTDEEYISEWTGVQYLKKGFADHLPEYFTAKGERVRSKSEVIIADTLNREGIPYRYEYPVQIKGLGKIHPDFTVLNVKERKEFFWEHLGMMDDETYAENAVQRINAYEQNGIFPGEKLILTYETKENPVNQKQIKNVIQHYLK